MSMFGLWSSGTSTPKRTSTLKPAPLTPKLTTATSPQYPPYLTTHDGQWEHIKPGSPPSPDAEDDTTFERLGFSQVDAGELRSTPPSGPSGSPPRWQEEMDRMRQDLEVSRAAQQKAERDRDHWERKVMELRTNMRSEREKDGPSSRSRRERERDKEREPGVVPAGMEALKEENEKLKGLLQQQAQQFDATQEEMKKERSQAQSDMERLKGELDTASTAYKKEVDGLKANSQDVALRVEYLTSERDRLRKDRDSVRSSLTTEIERMKTTQAKEAELTKKALEEVNLERMQALSDLGRTRKSLDAYALQLDNSVHEVDDLRRQLSASKDWQRTAAELRQRLEAQSKELRSARDESSALKKEFNQLLTLLDDRTSELKGAQSFLTTADAFSGAEVTSTLQRLNAEVLQSTAFMAESMVEQFFPEIESQDSKTKERPAACKRASDAIGETIVHFLGTKKHKDDPILIQIAFQAYLTYHLHWIACAWIIGGEENHNRFIDSIYHSVHEKEAQAIAGRWRALTRAHVPSTRFDDSQIAYQIASKIASGLSDILLTAGCTAPKSDITLALSSKFSEKLSFLVSLAVRVNKIVGEDVTSGDFEVLAIPPGSTFDVASMEDSYHDGDSAKGSGSTTSKVLCATDLGLRKKTRLALAGEKQWETKMMLKPKIALESVINSMDE